MALTLYAANSRTGGICRLRFENDSWQVLSPLRMVPGAHSLLVAGEHLFSAHDMEGGPRQAPGIINSWHVDGHGDCEWLGGMPTGGQSPNCIALNPAGTLVAVSHFRGIGETGGLSLHPVLAGRVQPAVARVERRTPLSGRVSHLHGVRFLADDLLLATDFGADEFLLHAWTDGRLRELGAWSAPGGSGPRSLALLPGGRRIAVTTQTQSSLIELAWDDVTRRLTLAQPPLPLLPPAWRGANSASDCVAHPGGGWIYAANRGHDSIALFKNTGERLVPAGHFPCGGRTPRALAISPDGRFIAAALEGSDCTVVLALPPGGGAATGPCAELAGVAPVAVAFGREHEPAP